MFKLSYTQPHNALDEWYLTEVTNPTGLVRCFHLTSSPPNLVIHMAYGSHADGFWLTFTPNGLAIQGEFSTGQGMSAKTDIEWFATPKSDEELLSRFFQRKEYQEAQAERDLRVLATSASPQEKEKLLGIASDLKVLADQPQLMKAVLNFGYTMDTASEIGVAFPIADAGWLIAIHRRFCTFMGKGSSSTR